MTSPNFGRTDLTTSIGHGFGGGTCPLCPLLPPVWIRPWYTTLHLVVVMMSPSGNYLHGGKQKCPEQSLHITTPTTSGCLALGLAIITTLAYA